MTNPSTDSDILKIEGKVLKDNMEAGSTSISLEILPDELVLNILDRFPTRKFSKRNNHLRTLCNFALTNRRFHRLAIPYIYRDIDDGGINIRKLVRSITNEPELGNHIRSIRWCVVDRNGRDDETWKTTSFKEEEDKDAEDDDDDKDDNQDESNSPATQDSDEDKFMKNMTKETLLMTLLAHSINLFDLCAVDDGGGDMDKYYDPDSPPSWFNFLCASVIDCSNRFQRLQKLNISLCGMRLEHIHAVIQLPVLRWIGLAQVVHLTPELGWEPEKCEKGVSLA
ncbi:hypothetical protein CC78DRAFT_72404 [Lojkania enalia]|uniref:F-box domain-containing protein n=1 Tax=Lojkania enalia TaxID=147567 RepID=A0A9P4N231_9PLEO|nr:hypothetical protein CC78DRAFT_72404 [Didymosphaeria enalia]